MSIKDRRWVALFDEPVALTESELPDCCKRVARQIGAWYTPRKYTAFECPSCGAVFELEDSRER